MIAIEKNVPFPGEKRKKRCKYADVIKSLEVGDSFLYAYKGTERCARAYVRLMRKWYAPDFKIKSAAEPGETKQIRVWRVA